MAKILPSHPASVSAANLALRKVEENSEWTLSMNVDHSPSLEDPKD